MKIQRFLVNAGLLLLLATIASASDYDRAFERLKALVGTWDIEGDDRVVVYSLTGNGETLIEDFKGRPAMSSFYHRDGDGLRLTHYCNAGNQPRMKAVAYDGENGILSFELEDVTNLSSPAAYHTRDLEIHFRDENHIELEFTGMKDAETTPSALSLSRRH